MKFERGDILSIQIMNAKELISADLNGLSDPYIQVISPIDNNKLIYKTQIINKTLNPEWYETFHYEIEKDILYSMKFKFNVFDHDKFSKDDSLGECELLIDDNSQCDVWYEKELVLEKVEKGRLNICYSIHKAKSSGLLSSSKQNQSDLFNNDVITIKVLSAENLMAADKNGLSDPYVQIITSIDNFKVHSTSIIQNNLNPIWNNESFPFMVISPSSFVEFKLKVMDKDEFLNDDFLGEFNLRIDKKKYDKYNKDYTINLILDKATSGKLNIQLRIEKLLK
ncbi:hypothetical protein ABK040_014153 [Willaertia magna]